MYYVTIIRYIYYKKKQNNLDCQINIDIYFVYWSMNIEVKVKRIEGSKNLRYDLTLKTYKESITGIFDKEDLRHLIQQIDNEIV